MGKLKFGKKSGHGTWHNNWQCIKVCTMYNHITKVCRKAKRKLSAFSRIPRYLSMKHKKLLYMCFIEAQFKYCSLTWMFCSRSCSNKIKKLQGRASRLVYDEYESPDDVLLNINKSFSIHHQNIQRHMIEIYKSLNKPFPDNLFDSMLASKQRKNAKII